MKTNKSSISKANKKSGDAPPSSEMSFESPNTTKNNSDGAKLFQQGYMRKKDIEKVLKEEEDRNDTRRWTIWEVVEKGGDWNGTKQDSRDREEVKQAWGRAGYNQ